MPTLTHPATVTLARHYIDMAGWLHAAYFDGCPDRRAANDALLADGRVVAGLRGRSATYEFTAAGHDWLARQGS